MYGKTKVWIAIVLILFCVGYVNGTARASDILIVKVSGTAAAGQEMKALEDAKKRAVFKVFSHDTRAESSADSIFYQMMERYGDYVDSCKVLQKSTSGSQLLVIAEVGVRHRKLEQDFNELVAKKQEKNDDMTASIAIRAIRTSNNSGYGESLDQAFYHQFGKQGFQVEHDEDLVAAKNKFEADDYANYAKTMKSLIDNNTVMVNFAIIGEAGIMGVISNPVGKGYMGKAFVRLQAYDCMNNIKIGEFLENYEILANTREEVERLVLTKAGLDAAEKMAKDTLKYWRKRNGLS